MGVKVCDRTVVSQQQSMQRSASSVECNEAMWEGPVMQKVKVHHQVCESPAGTLEHPMTNEILYDQESLQCVSAEQCFSPAQVTHFKGSSWGQGKEREHEQMRENEKNIERSDNQETRRERVVQKRDMEWKRKSERVAKRLKMMNLDSDLGLQHCRTPTGGGRDTRGPDIFRHPDPMKRNQCVQPLSDDEMSLCSELLDREINRFLKPPSPTKPSNLRCAGCVKHMNEMDSRSFGAVVRSCRFQCDFHLVLQEVEDRFKRSQQLEKTSHNLTNAHINTHGKNREHSTCTNGDNKRSTMEKHRLSHQPTDRCFRLTPLRRPCETNGPDMEKNMHHIHEKKTSEYGLPKNSTGRHRERQNWSADELRFLKMGVKRFGHSWNSILWTYPFHPSRTNIGLAKKYRNMQKAKAQDVDLSVQEMDKNIT